MGVFSSVVAAAAGGAATLSPLPAASTLAGRGREGDSVERCRTYKFRVLQMNLESYRRI